MWDQCTNDETNKNSSEHRAQHGQVVPRPMSMAINASTVVSTRYSVPAWNAMLAALEKRATVQCPTARPLFVLPQNSANVPAKIQSSRG